MIVFNAPYIVPRVWFGKSPKLTDGDMVCDGDVVAYKVNMTCGLGRACSQHVVRHSRWCLFAPILRFGCSLGHFCCVQL